MDMSYDINLYDRNFLERALTRQLGDWRGAPALDDGVARDIALEATRLGFQRVAQDPRFAAFAAAQGHAVADEYTLDSTDVLAQLMVFRNSVTFSIPSSNRALQSISWCHQTARAMAAKHGLGLYESQTGEAGG